MYFEIIYIIIHPVGAMCMDPVILNMESYLAR